MRPITIYMLTGPLIGPKGEPVWCVETLNEVSQVLAEYTHFAADDANAADLSLVAVFTLEIKSPGSLVECLQHAVRLTLASQEPVPTKIELAMTKH